MNGSLLNIYQFWKRKVRYILIPFFAALRRIRLPGFGGAGLYDVCRFWFQTLFDSRFNLMAAAIAYNFFFALFPTLILLFTLIPFLPIKDLQGEILFFFRENVPEASMEIVESVVKASFQKMGTGLISLNLFLALIASMRGIIAMMHAFSETFVAKKTRKNIFQLYGTAFLIFFILALFLVLSTVFLNLGEFFIDKLKHYNWITKTGIDFILLKASNYFLTFVLLIFSITTTYKLGGGSTQHKFFSPGSITAGSLLLLTLIGLHYYFANFGSFNKIYGSLGTVIILMLWFYYIAVVLLIGNRLNHAIERAQRYKRIFKGE